MAPEAPKKKQLGRGLSALLGETLSTDPALGLQSRNLPVEKLHPSPYQPRRHFDEEALEALAASIRQQGVVQPLLVRVDPADASLYEIVAGERRWRAAQRAQLHEVPCVIKALRDDETLEIALVENIQREDLTALEEARAYRQLIDQFHHTQEVLSQNLGKSRSHIANMLRLLTLPEPVQRLLMRGTLSVGHVRALINAPNPVEMAEKIVGKGLTVRETERLAQASKLKKPRKLKAVAGNGAEIDADTLALERDLSLVLGLRVTIRHEAKGGNLTLHYSSLEQLDDLLQRLNQSPGAAN
jgi:ParB family chromosome partitioning protein